jgi:hypothetical protein
VANPPNFNDGSVFWVMGCSFNNAGNQDQYVTLTDGASNIIMQTMRIPAYSLVPVEWPFMPTTGLRWVATGALTGKVWGYT